MSTALAELPVLAKVIQRLDGAGIPYFLTGSLALNFYGHARATNDVDIVLQLQRDDADRVFDLFRRDFYVSEEAIAAAIAGVGVFNVIDNESIFKVDLIVSTDDVYGREKFLRRRTIAVGGLSLQVISPEDLILSKLDWSRWSLSELQERDIVNIIKCVGVLDWDYLKKWAGVLNVWERLERLA